MKLKIDEWKDEIDEFCVLPLFHLTWANRVMTISVGWLFWIYEFTIKR